MFRKTIAVLLMLSIVLSSCGKKDKDKNNDFVRTTPVNSSTTSTVDFQSPVLSYPLVVPSPSTTYTLASVSCLETHKLCFESLQYDYESSTPRCGESDFTCIESIFKSFKSNSSSPSYCIDSYQQECYRSLLNNVATTFVHFDRKKYNSLNSAGVCLDSEVTCYESLLNDFSNCTSSQQEVCFKSMQSYTSAVAQDCYESQKVCFRHLLDNSQPDILVKMEELRAKEVEAAKEANSKYWTKIFCKFGVSFFALIYGLANAIPSERPWRTPILHYLFNLVLPVKTAHSKARIAITSFVFIGMFFVPEVILGW